ncbi:MAG: hypothetical protein WAK85_18300, partial [Xanthobacteraceae bacterium]
QELDDAHGAAHLWFDNPARTRCDSNGLGSGGNCYLADPAGDQPQLRAEDIKRDPRFSNTVRRVVIIGNMMALLQLPAGKVTLRNNRKKFCGLVQLRSVLFRRDKITYLLFQQDLMYHLAHTRT